jgi:hypothetical protein
MMLIKAHLRWVPWIKAFTGARLDGIRGANIADLYQLGGVDIRLDNRGEDGPRKTEASERKLFLHPTLIAEGILGYVYSLPKDGPMDRCFLALRRIDLAAGQGTAPRQSGDGFASGSVSPIPTISLSR